ncbi:TOMM precursor leader peptide-binding protein [Actinomycetospora sp. TBRC 11914]|uniref:TOMM precursor leader peptide-binding protein n=1 Tax=Actinomycetospora sp. TBRC 11914 TaxID=2729387 RepID=UPI00145E2DC6|nr:TOMM precursor leader peptide-binding protein [Actinomycetospora sp. TBRC 11914]NMO88716.1 TOMM precursor leader peptide-binding protein [Actinomycetospora sp. TBRC 11914]
MRPLPRDPADRPVLLWRDAATAQFGSDPATALILAGLSPPLAALVRALDAGVPPARAVAEVLARGGAPGEVAAVVAALAGAGLVAAPRPAPGPSYVRVHGAGRLGTAVAVALAAAGVGRVAVRARCAVAPADVGTGLRDADVGRPALVAVAEALARTAPAVVVSEPTRRRPDLVVLVGPAATDLVLAARLSARHQPHLAVTAHGGRGVVGPLVLPGRGSCLRCAERHRAAADPAWPRLAAQLAGRPAGVGPTTATAVAALAVEHVLAHLAGTPTLVDAALELDLAGGAVTRLDRPAHPACGCAPRPEGVRPGRADAVVPGDNRPRVVR